MKAKDLHDHYFTLEPFRAQFETGLPILLYHKVGRAGVGDRRKGLYVSNQLFADQLAELTQAGFRFSTLGSMHPARKVVVTFDDGYASCFEHGLRVLEHVGCEAIQFLVSGRIGKSNDWDKTGEAIMDISQIREWLAAGHSIGSHTVSHPNLTSLSVSDASAEIQTSRKWLEDTFGVAVTHFSYPLGAFNERIIELVKTAGYSTAVTTEFGVNGSETDDYKLRRILAYRSYRETLCSVIRWDAK